MSVNDLYKEAAKKTDTIKLLILDVDGVLTDGAIYLDNNGNELKSFNVRDGLGIKLAQKAGLTVAIITGRESLVVENRARELGIRDLYQGVEDKGKAYKNLLDKYKYTDDNVAFMGDDIIDLPVMTSVGLPAVPADADTMVMKYALFVSRKKGGQGAVREFIEFILKSSDRWEGLINEYSR